MDDQSPHPLRRREDHEGWRRPPSAIIQGVLTGVIMLTIVGMGTWIATSLQANTRAVIELKTSDSERRRQEDERHQNTQSALRRNVEAIQRNVEAIQRNTLAIQTAARQELHRRGDPIGLKQR